MDLVSIIVMALLVATCMMKVLKCKLSMLQYRSYMMKGVWHGTAHMHYLRGGMNKKMNAYFMLGWTYLSMSLSLFQS